MSKFKIDFQWYGEENKISVEKICGVEFNSERELVIHGRNSDGEDVSFTRDSEELKSLCIKNVSEGGKLNGD